jgi:glucuronate isomerase
MKQFIHDDFMLHNNVAKRLYHDYAKKMPIIDYHCHLNPKEIFENKQFNIVEVWLAGDHYKWRLMRANGVDEEYITGNKGPFEKFLKWAEVVEVLFGNPLYHWTHFELKRFFGIDKLLNTESAKEIYDEVNEKLKRIKARDLINLSNVEYIGTTDDPLDNLEWHELIKNDDSFNVKVLPAFRPDKAVDIELSWFCDWVKDLSKIVDYEICDLLTFKEALRNRIRYFHNHGCRLADHALDIVKYEDSTSDEVNYIFLKALSKEQLTESDVRKYKGHLLVFFGREYKKLDWVQQYHIGALRNVSRRMLNKLGPDTGFDAINDGIIAVPLARLLDALDATGELPKTILYTLNPNDFEVAITLMQSFQGGGVPGKIQFGSPWWFLDTIDGMRKHFKALSSNGLLARFIGMLTDSRSFLSYPRHEYFRRVLCNFMGEQVDLGYFPEDYQLLGKMVENICYYNAKNYFNL